QPAVGVCAVSEEHILWYAPPSGLYPSFPPLLMPDGGTNLMLCPTLAEAH